MDVNTRTAFYKHAQGLLTSLLLSSVLALCTSTPIPPEQLHPRQHYERLVRDAHVLHSQHRNVYTSFKTIRHGDASIRLDDFRIEGIPNINDLPAPNLRYSMEESELLPIHYTRLQAFEQILARATADEFKLGLEGDDNFHESMMTVLVLLRRVVSKLRQTMVGLEIAHDYDTVPAIPPFSANQNDAIVNMRILFVLQEFDDNLAPALEDFTNFMNTHQHPSS